MKEIAKQARRLIEDMQQIADNLEKYNPGRRCKDKTPLDVIQYDLCLLGARIDMAVCRNREKDKK